MKIVTGPRVFLRHVHIGDLSTFTALFADPEVMFFGPGPQSHDWTKQWIAGCLQDYYETWGFGLWAVADREHCRVLGYCGLTHFEDVDGQAEIELGYRLIRASWGHGLGTEAATLARDYAMGTLGLRRLIALIHPDNHRSIRVAVKDWHAPRKEHNFSWAARRPLRFPEHTVTYSSLLL
jgi:[ribosomal protein S5]-alanine N-acetyltransferase